MNKIAITLGDFNGIGTEITLKALRFFKDKFEKIILIAPKSLLDYYTDNFHLPISNKIEIIEPEFDLKNLKFGMINAKSGEFSFQSLKIACDLYKSGKIKNIVTAPVAKEALNLAGHKFNGQTEIIEYFCAKEKQKAQMLFICENLKILLMTRHIALKDVSTYFTPEFLTQRIEETNYILKNNFKIKSPKLAICALNPHSGENGIIGTEEKKIFIPTIEKLRKTGINITNPIASDSLFCELNFKNPEYDCILACYHDQALIPIKMYNRKKTVNTTVGLDLIRTSPAHGTAFDIAGKMKADETSMVEAIKLALDFL